MIEHLPGPGGALKEQTARSKPNSGFAQAGVKALPLPACCGFPPPSLGLRTFYTPCFIFCVQEEALTEPHPSAFTLQLCKEQLLLQEGALMLPLGHDAQGIPPAGWRWREGLDPRPRPERGRCGHWEEGRSFHQVLGPHPSALGGGLCGLQVGSVCSVSCLRGESLIFEGQMVHKGRALPL